MSWLYNGLAGMLVNLCKSIQMILVKWDLAWLFHGSEFTIGSLHAYSVPKLMYILIFVSTTHWLVHLETIQARRRPWSLDNIIVISIFIHLIICSVWQSQSFFFQFSLCLGILNILFISGMHSLYIIISLYLYDPLNHLHIVVIIYARWCIRSWQDQNGMVQLLRKWSEYGNCYLVNCRDIKNHRA